MVKTLLKYSAKLKKFIEIPFKNDQEVIDKMFEDEVAQAIADGLKDFQPKGKLDEYGREICDPVPNVVEVKELTLEQKMLNQLIMAHNKAALERQNLPFDISDPSQVRELMNLDIPDEDIQVLSQYEMVDMVEDYPDLPPPQVDGEPYANEPAPSPEPAPEPEPEPAT